MPGCIHYQRQKNKCVTKGILIVKKEYDFSKGVRGKFYHPEARLNLPIYLEKEVEEFI